MLLAACAAPARDPAKVQDVGRNADALEQRQQRTGAAYRELEQVRFELKLAQQDWMNADAAYRAAQNTANELKQQADKAHQALVAAQAREAQARAAYDQAMRGVDELYRSGTAAEKR
jgi:chromosome segregation ATPase